MLVENVICCKEYIYCTMHAAIIGYLLYVRREVFVNNSLYSARIVCLYTYTTILY